MITWILKINHNGEFPFFVHLIIYVIFYIISIIITWILTINHTGEFPLFAMTNNRYNTLSCPGNTSSK